MNSEALVETRMSHESATSIGNDDAGDGCSVDLGNLTIVDPRHLDAKDFITPSAADATVWELGREVLQTLTQKLFGLPSTADKTGRIVELPPPTAALPREKSIPKPRPPTKWEKFAQSKGITKRKRSKMEYDEDAGEYKRRHGYKRLNDEKEVPIIMAKASDVPGSDPFTSARADKKARVAKNQKSQLQNLKAAAKKSGPAALPSSVQLSAVSLPITGTKALPRKMRAEEYGGVAGVAATATASGGKFDKKRAEEKPLKKVGKHRKFLPVVDAGHNGRERQQMQKILGNVIAKNDHDVDMNKAVTSYNVAEEKKNRVRKESGDESGAKKGSGGKRQGGKGGPLANGKQHKRQKKMKK